MAVRKIIKILTEIVLSIVIFILLLGGALFLYLSQNDAKTVAEPFERSFAVLGATKYCESGDGGHFLNDQPWYEARYDVPLPREAAVEFIKKVGETNGYSISQASPQHHGYVDVGEVYFKDNYFATFIPQKGLVGNITFRLYKDSYCPSGQVKTKGDASYYICTRHT